MVGVRCRGRAQILNYFSTRALPRRKEKTETILIAKKDRVCSVQARRRVAQVWDSYRRPTWAARARVLGRCRAVWVNGGVWMVVGRGFGHATARAVHYDCGGKRSRLRRNGCGDLKGLGGKVRRPRRCCLRAESWLGDLVGQLPCLETCCRGHSTLDRNRQTGSRCVGRPEPWTG